MEIFSREADDEKTKRKTPDDNHKTFDPLRNTNKEYNYSQRIFE